MNNKNVLLSFLIGSSIFAISLQALYKPNTKLSPILIPILFGLTNVLNVYLQNKFKTENISIFAGFLVSLLMYFIYKRFDLESRLSKHKEVIMTILYVFIFGVVIQYLNNYLNLLTFKYDAAVNHPAAM